MVEYCTSSHVRRETYAVLDGSFWYVAHMRGWVTPVDLGLCFHPWSLGYDYAVNTGKYCPSCRVREIKSAVLGRFFSYFAQVTISTRGCFTDLPSTIQLVIGSNIWVWKRELTLFIFHFNYHIKLYNFYQLPQWLPMWVLFNGLSH